MSFSSNVRSLQKSHRRRAESEAEITKLGKRLNIRQVVLATAFIFVRRFYLKVQIRRTNPYLVIATAFYLACKIEECPQHIKVVVSEARTLWQGMIADLTVVLC